MTNIGILAGALGDGISFEEVTGHAAGDCELGKNFT